jgi:hypothetical protein
MTQKIQFIIAVLSVMQDLARSLRKVRDLVKVYTDRGYGTTDLITDADFSSSRPGEYDLVGITAEKFNEAAGVLVEFQSFMSGIAAAAKDREAIINKIRKDL